MCGGPEDEEGRTHSDQEAGREHLRKSSGCGRLRLRQAGQHPTAHTKLLKLSAGGRGRPRDAVTQRWDVMEYKSQRGPRGSTRGERAGGENRERQWSGRRNCDWQTEGRLQGRGLCPVGQLYPECLPCVWHTTDVRSMSAERT